MDAESVPGVPPRVRNLKACDQCRYRRRRCIHRRQAERCESCERLGWGCTYETKSTVARERKYVAHLEQKVRRLEDQISLIRSAEQNYSRQDTASNPDSASDCAHRHTPRTVAKDSLDFSPDPRSFEYASPTPAFSDDSGFVPSQSPTPESMNCDNNMLLGISEQNSVHYAQCSGLEMLRRLRVDMDSLAGLNNTSEDPTGSIMIAALDRSIVLDLLKANSLPRGFRPPQPRLAQFINTAFTEVFSVWPVMSRASINDIATRLYSPTVSGYDNVHKDELALIYAVLALGERFEWAKVPISDPELRRRRLNGMAYFKAAQDLVQPSDCHRSIAALHTTICLAIYLVAASAHMQAYSYLSSAVLASMSMGLYNLNKPADQPSGYSTSVDQVTYRTLGALDIYLSNLLGFPRSGLMTSVDSTASWSARLKAAQADYDNSGLYAEAHSTLLGALGEVQQMANFSDIAASDELITEVGNKFDEWYKSALPLLEPSPKLTSAQSFRSRLVLQYAYACVRMIAYAPFLRYALHGDSGERNKLQALAGNLCIMAATQTSRVARLMESHGMFNVCCTLSYNGPVFAACVLLITELGACNDLLAMEEVVEASRNAELSLNQLAMGDAAVEVCAESLKPIYWIASREKQFLRLYGAPNNHDEICHTGAMTNISNHSQVPCRA